MAAGWQSSTDDGFQSDTQTTMSDADAYSSDRPNASGSPFANYPTKIDIPPHRALHSWLFLSPMQYNQSMHNLITKNLDQIRFIARRWPTQGETDAIIANAHTSVVTVNTCMTSGLMAAFGILLSPSTRLRLGRLAPHISVFAKVPIVGFSFPLAGGFVGSVLATTIVTRREKTDPRMEAYRKERMDLSPEEHLRRRRQLQAYQAERQRKVRPRRPTSSEPVSPPRSSMPDETSPTAGGFASEFGRDHDRQQEDSTILREVYTRQGEGTRPSSEGASMHQTKYSQSPTQHQQQSQQPDSTSGQWGKDSVDMSGSSGAASSTSGSVWDRIRQQARPPQQGQSNSPQQQSSRWTEIQQNPQATQPSQNDTSQSASWSTSPSSYPSQESSQDTNSEKEKAQREFDALLERERNLGADSSGAGGSGNQSGRWGRRW